MPKRICEGLWLVGGDGLSDSRDCLVYLLDLGDWVLIDSGAGPGWPSIRRHMEQAGCDVASLHTLVLTHGHVDHIGAAAEVVAKSGCRVVAHEGDKEAIETGDPRRTAASWYGMTLPGCRVDRVVSGDKEVLHFAAGELTLLHTPGHTPGSMVAVTKLDGRLVLFGQDIHGPFMPAFGSDIKAWRTSMERLLELDADILCEGHYGIFQGRSAVRAFIEDQLRVHARRTS